jgi:hypothetical protein
MKISPSVILMLFGFVLSAGVSHAQEAQPWFKVETPVKAAPKDTKVQPVQSVPPIDKNALSVLLGKANVLIRMASRERLMIC